MYEHFLDFGLEKANPKLTEEYTFERITDIKSLTDKDVSTIIKQAKELGNSERMFFKENGLDISDYTGYSGSGEISTFIDALKDNGKDKHSLNVVEIVRYKGKIVANCGLVIIAKHTFTAIINEVFVSKTHRQKGLAEKMIINLSEHVKEIGKINKVTHPIDIDLRVNVANKKAINLYKKLNFKSRVLEMTLQVKADS